jgi:hypothetical protein
MNSKLLPIYILCALITGSVPGRSFTATVNIQDTTVGPLRIFDQYANQIGGTYSGPNSQEPHLDGEGNIDYWILTFSVNIPDAQNGLPLQLNYANAFSNSVTISASSPSVSLGLGSFVNSGPTSPVVPIAGTLDVKGSTFNFGRSPYDSGSPAFQSFIWLNDGYGGGPDGLVHETFSSSLPAIWRWGGWETGMELEISGVTAAVLRISRIEANTILQNGQSLLTSAAASGLYLPLQPAKLAIGTGSVASQTGNFSSGQNATASGLNSSAFGRNTAAQGYNQFVVGEYNIPVGTGGINTNAEDPLFIVGNGTSSIASNALTVKRSGDADIRGKVSALGLAAGDGVVSAQRSQIVLGKFNDQRTNDGGINHTQGIFIIGSGTSTSAGMNAMRVLDDGSGTILIKPQGNLSMGQFGSGSQP